MHLNVVRAIDDAVPVRHVLVSVADKKGLDELVPALAAALPGLTIYSTGGTFDALRAIVPSGARLVQVSEYTGQPEMQGGLVKTLDFRIYLGLLSETYNDAHRADLERTRSVAIDMVVCNLYPFTAAIAARDATPESARGNIDIGGPCMVRAAAKNFLRVASLTDPADYAPIAREIAASGGKLGLQTRFRLARKAFRHIAEYDAAISRYLDALSFEAVAACYEVRGGTPGEANVSSADIRRSYRTIMDDSFPRTMEVSFSDGRGGERQTLVFEKASWVIDGVEKGLRYGENPGQEAAMYRLVNGNLHLGDVRSIQPGRYLATNVELLQSGKHPGKTNITDADNALNILRYFTDLPTTIIVKHNNPCGVARDRTLSGSFVKANLADRVAAYGGCIACNRSVDRETAELIAEQYAEVVVAPDFESGVMDLFARKKNLRVMRIANMSRLREFVGERFLDVKSLVDGGMIVQWSFAPRTLKASDFLPAVATHKGQEHRVARAPTAAEYEDLLFGWLIECGVISNSVIYVKDGVTVGIGTGEQDRVGVAEIARDKAYRKLADRIAWERFHVPYNDMIDAAGARAMGVPDGARDEIDAEVRAKKGGLPGSAMVSDAFFPFRDGVDVGLREGVSAVVQPGGAERDHEVIEAVNQAGAAMVFTGQRCFKH